jgi:hypothetical protein
LQSADSDSDSSSLTSLSSEEDIEEHHVIKCKPFLLSCQAKILIRVYNPVRDIVIPASPMIQDFASGKPFRNDIL